MKLTRITPSRWNRLEVKAPLKRKSICRLDAHFLTPSSHSFQLAGFWWRACNDNYNMTLAKPYDVSTNFCEISRQASRQTAASCHRRCRNHLRLIMCRGWSPSWVQQHNEQKLVIGRHGARRPASQRPRKMPPDQHKALSIMGNPYGR